MFLGRVTGHVVATQKDKVLSGQKLYVVEPLNVKYGADGRSPARVSGRLSDYREYPSVAQPGASLFLT